MAETVIWNNTMTMCFLAHEFQAARITYPNCPAHEGRHWVRVHLKGSRYDDVGRSSGLRYAACTDEESAKNCIAKLIEKLVRAGAIEATEKGSGHRFDHVELQEENDEDD